MKKFLGIVACIFIVVSCSSRKIEDGGWDVVIKGKVSFPQAGIITLRELTPDNTGKIDSVVLGSNNMYEKKIHLMQAGFYQFNFYNLQILNVILNKSNLEINVDGNNMQGFSEVKGSAEQDLIARVQTMTSQLQALPEMASLEKQFSAAAQAHDEAKMEALRQQYMAVLKKEHDKIAELLLQQPASLAVLDLLMQGNLLDRDEYAGVYEDAALKLKRELPNSPYGKVFISQVEKLKATSIGIRQRDLGRLFPD